MSASTTHTYTLAPSMIDEIKRPTSWGMSDWELSAYVWVSRNMSSTPRPSARNGTICHRGGGRGKQPVKNVRSLIGVIIECQRQVGYLGGGSVEEEANDGAESKSGGDRHGDQENSSDADAALWIDRVRPSHQRHACVYQLRTGKINYRSKQTKRVKECESKFDLPSERIQRPPWRRWFARSRARYPWATSSWRRSCCDGWSSCSWPSPVSASPATINQNQKFWSTDETTATTAQTPTCLKERCQASRIWLALRGVQSMLWTW